MDLSTIALSILTKYFMLLVKPFQRLYLKTDSGLFGYMFGYGI